MFSFVELFKSFPVYFLIWEIKTIYKSSCSVKWNVNAFEQVVIYGSFKKIEKREECHLTCLVIWYSRWTTCLLFLRQIEKSEENGCCFRRPSLPMLVISATNSFIPCCELWPIHFIATSSPRLDINPCKLFQILPTLQGFLSRTLGGRGQLSIFKSTSTALNFPIF